MADAYVGEIRMFAGTFAPVGWHFCDGTLLAVKDYQVLFALLGTVYGGDGVNTFGLPNLKSRVPVGQGTLNGVTHTLAQTFGAETVTLTVATMPQHTHALEASSAAASTLNPANAYLGTIQGNNSFYFANTGATSGADQPLNNAPPFVACGNAGQSIPHPNIMPSFGINFIMATAGIYPSRP